MPAGEWFKAAFCNDRKTLARYAGTKAALTELVGAYGGYTVPTEVCKEIMGLVADESPLWSRCPVLPMKSLQLDVPVIDMTAANTAGNPAWFGGMTMAWSTDGAAITESDPTFEQETIVATALTGLILMSNPLFDDSEALQAFLKQLAANIVRWYTEQAFMVGDGVNKPLGMASLANPALLTVQAVSGSLGSNLTQMVSYLSPYSYGSAVWFFHPSYYVKLFARATTTDAVPPNAVSNIPGQNLFGFPAFPFDRLSATSGQPVAALVDPKQYVIGQRLEMEVAFSPHPKFTNNQTYMRIILRVGGRPLWRTSAKLPDASNNVSPYVALLAI